MPALNTATLPGLLRAVAFGLVAAWIAWQLLTLLPGQAESRGLPAVLIGALLAGSLMVLAIRYQARLGPGHWRPLDTALLLMLGVVALVEGRLLSGNGPAENEAVIITAWTDERSVDGRAPDGRDSTAVAQLEGAWRELLWTRTDLQPVVLMQAGTAAPGDLRLDGVLRDDGAAGAITVTLTLRARDRVLREAVFPLASHLRPASSKNSGPGAEPVAYSELVNNSLRALFPPEPSPATDPSTSADTIAGYDAWLANGALCRDGSAAGARRALAARRRALADNPAAFGLHSAFADCLLALGQRGLVDGNGWRHEARASANRALTLDGTHLFTLDTAARVAWLLDRQAARAGEYWQAALAKHPYHARLRYQLAAMLAAEGDDEGARAQFEIARRHAPDYPLDSDLQILRAGAASPDTGNAGNRKNSRSP